MDEDYHDVLACTANVEELAESITAKLRVGDRGGAISQLSECMRRRTVFNRKHPVRQGDTSHIDIIKFIYVLKTKIRSLPAGADLHNIGVVVHQYLSLNAEVQLYPLPDGDPRIWTIPTGRSIYSITIQECPCETNVERPFKQIVEQVYKDHIERAATAKRQFEIARSGSVVPEFRVGDFNEAVRIAAGQHAQPGARAHAVQADFGGLALQSVTMAAAQAVQTEYDKLKSLYDASFVNRAAVSSDARDAVRGDPVTMGILQRYEGIKNESFRPIQRLNVGLMWAAAGRTKRRKFRGKRTLRRRTSKMDLHNRRYK